MPKYLVETGDKIWTADGKDKDEGAFNAFLQIRDACHEDHSLKIDLSFWIRLEDEPLEKATKGDTIDMLRKIGEISDGQAFMLKFDERITDGE